MLEKMNTDINHLKHHVYQKNDCKKKEPTDIGHPDNEIKKNKKDDSSTQDMTKNDTAADLYPTCKPR